MKYPDGYKILFIKYITLCRERLENWGQPFKIQLTY